MGYSLLALLCDVIDDVRNHSILQYLFETLLEIQIRNTKHNALTHREYVQIKSEANAIYNSLTKLYRSINGIRHNIHRQIYLQKLLYLPGFLNEEKRLKQMRGFEEDIAFKSIEFEYIYFEYDD